MDSVKLSNQSFNTQLYIQRNPKLNDQDIRMLYKMFNSYPQVNGTIDTKDVLEKYRNSADNEEIQR